MQQFDSWLPVALYILVACIITAITVTTLKETRGASLRAIDAEDARQTQNA